MGTPQPPYKFFQDVSVELVDKTFLIDIEVLDAQLD